MAMYIKKLKCRYLDLLTFTADKRSHCLGHINVELLLFYLLRAILDCEKC